MNSSKYQRLEKAQRSSNTTLIEPHIKRILHTGAMLRLRPGYETLPKGPKSFDSNRNAPVNFIGR